MAPKKETKKSSGEGAKEYASQYNVYTKKFVWIEAACFAMIWLLFLIGLVTVLYFRAPTAQFETTKNLIYAGILFMSIAPFIANWTYYSAVWKAWREGREITYKQQAGPKPGFSVMGNREVWIRK